MADGTNGAAAQFVTGDAVRVRTVDPVGHTRVPRYVRGHTGRVLEETGSWPLADDVAARIAKPRVEPVYTVAFAARELWGEVAGQTHDVTVDIWQSSLEPVAGPAVEPTEEGAT